MLAADEIKRLLAVANEPLEDEEDNQAVAAPEPRLDFATQPESFASLDNRPAEQEAEDRAQIRATREHHQGECRGEQRSHGVADE